LGVGAVAVGGVEERIGSDRSDVTSSGASSNKAQTAPARATATTAYVRLSEALLPPAHPSARPAPAAVKLIYGPT
jgi:hypothetical protein